MTADDPTWLTAKEAAERLGLRKTQTVHEMCKRGEIRFYRLGREYRFRPADVDKAVRLVDLRRHATGAA